MENPYAKYAQPQQGPINSGFKPEDPYKGPADARDERRLSILEGQEAARIAKEAKEAQDKTDEETRSKASMLVRLKEDAKSIARLGRDANDNGGFGETGTSGSLSRSILPAGTAGYSLASELEKFKGKNAFTGLSELAAQGVKLTPVSEYEVKLAAASIANLDPDADHETFMRAVNDTKKYYYDAIARIDPLEAYQTALENGESAEAITEIAKRNNGPVPEPAFLQQAVDFTAGGGTGASFRPPEDTPPDNGGGGLGQALYAGVGDVAKGVGDVLGLVGNPLNAGINAIAGTNLSTDLGQTFRQATGAPDGDPLASAINTAGTSALTTAGISGLARPIASGVTQTVTNALAQQPIQQGVAGASAGASSELARQSGANPLLQAAAGVAGGIGGFASAGGVNALIRASQPAQAAPIVAEAARARVPLMTTDVVPPKTVVGKSARKLGELIPLAGTAGPRTTQQEARVNAVKSLAREFEIDEASLDDVAKDLAKTRGNQIKTFKGQKDQILDNVTVPAPAPRAIAELDKQIAAASKVQTASSKALVAKLQDFKSALQNGGNTLKELEAIRKEMGAAFKDPSLASIADAGTKAVRSVYGPLRDDMGATIREAAGPDAARSWRVANARLSSMADELQSTALKSTLNKAASTPEDVAKLLFSAKPSQVRLLYNNLSSEGRAKAQGVLIGKAVEKAGESPDKFANELDRLSKNVGIFFQDSDLARVQGLGRVLQATKRASQAGVQPENGSQLLPYAVPASLTSLAGTIFGTTSAGVVGSMGIGAGLLARLYESAPVRNALLKLGRTKPGSPQEQGAMARAMTAIAAANDNPEMQAFMSNAPTSARAVASEGEQEGVERPIKP